MLVDEIVMFSDNSHYLDIYRDASSRTHLSYLSGILSEIIFCSLSTKVESPTRAQFSTAPLGNNAQYDRLETA